MRVHSATISRTTLPRPGTLPHEPALLLRLSAPVEGTQQFTLPDAVARTLLDLLLMALEPDADAPAAGGIHVSDAHDAGRS